MTYVETLEALQALRDAAPSTQCEELRWHAIEAIPTRDLRDSEDPWASDGYHSYHRWMAEGQPEVPDHWLTQVGRALAVLAVLAVMIGAAVYGITSGDYETAADRSCDPGMVARGGC